MTFFSIIDCTVSTTLDSKSRYCHLPSFVPLARMSVLTCTSHPVGCTPGGKICEGVPSGTRSRSEGKCFRIMFTTSCGVISSATSTMRLFPAAGLVSASTWPRATSRTSTYEVGPALALEFTIAAEWGRNMGTLTK